MLRNIPAASFLAPLLASALALGSSSIASANQYEVFIDVQNEEELYDLQVENQIGEDTLNALIELMQRGLDLNTANREELYTLPNITYAEVDGILKYRAEVGRIDDPAALAINGIISERQLAAVAPFLIIRKRTVSKLGASGWVRGQTRWSVDDNDAPPMALQARADGLRHVRVGAAVLLNRNVLGEVVYDPSRDALTAEEPSVRPEVPKLYVHWDERDYAIIGGTYRIGFGQRLTFDVTDQTDPNGFYGDDEVFRSTSLVSQCKESAGELAESPCSGAAGEVHVTPDFNSRDGLLGVALGLKKLELGGKSSISAYGFGSYQPKDVYQYAIYDAGKCSDPRDDDNDDCSSPDTFRTEGNVAMPTSRFSFHTLPNMYAELLGGGNVTVNIDRRTSVGVTGYGSYINWLVEGIDLDFQEWWRTPFGGPFGAVGVNAHHGIDIVDLFAEVTRSFDSQLDGGGGFAGIVRAVTAWDKHEIEVSGRYYDEKFANPYARPISAADQFDGLRARDEAGIRVRTSSRFQKKFSLRTSADFWRAPSEKVNEGSFYVRGDADILKYLRVGLWTAYQDKEIFDDGGPQCFAISTEDDENGEPIPCGGERYQVTGRVRYEPFRNVAATLQYTHEVQDDDDLDMDADVRFRQDRVVTAIVTAKPIPQASIRARFRFLDEDIKDAMSLETSSWTSLDFSYRLRRKDRLRLRYDLIAYHDERDSTQDRQPSPEHWLWFEYTAHF